MENILLAVPFATSKTKYIYDGVTSEIIPSSDLIETIINQYFTSSKDEIYKMTDHIMYDEFEHTYEYISRLIDEGMFYKKQQIESVNQPIKERILNSSGSQLTFVLTEKCNMRCEYCVYSDKYPHEIGYSDIEMNFDIAKRAINEFLEIHNQRVKRGYTKPPFICFYGGEPLLKIELIKQIVGYIDSIRMDAIYYITTNGLLLNQENAEFLIGHNFNITFSLDGFKENHNRNRVTIGRKETFDLIYHNIAEVQRIKKEKNISQIISFNCCYDNYTNIYDCIKFFENNYDLFSPFYCVYAPVKPYDTSYYDWVKVYMDTHDYNAEEDEFKRSIQRVKEEFFSKKEGNERFREIATSLFVGHYTFSIRNKWLCSEFNNSCMPLDKIAVYPDGSYAICEKMNGRLSVGDVYSGINYEKVEEIVRKFKEKFQTGKCSECPVRAMCNVCFMYMDNDGNFDEEFCEEQKGSFEKRLQEMYDLKEQGVDFMKMIDINKKQLEMLETMR